MPSSPSACHLTISARLTNAAVALTAVGLGSAMVTVMGALASIAMVVNLHKSLGIFMGCPPLFQRRSVGLWRRGMPLRDPNEEQGSLPALYLQFRKTASVHILRIQFGNSALQSNVIPDPM